jgi:hypothetical protein
LKPTSTLLINLINLVVYTIIHARRKQRNPYALGFQIMFFCFFIFFNFFVFEICAKMDSSKVNCVSNGGKRKGKKKEKKK